MQSPGAAYSLVIVSSSSTPLADPLATAVELDRLYRKLEVRLMPLFCMCIILNFIDRTSLAFASIQMTPQLHFSPEVLGLGGGLFFLSYCFMQVPSNLICMRVGVVRWLSGIMLVWGAVAALFAAVQVKWQFYVLRLLLGLAEAGSFPAVWYGISLWFPPARCSLPFALLNASVAASQIVAAPLAAALLRLDGVAGLAGWQWVFLGEGLPSIALALALPCLLPGRPGQMKGSSYLSQAELQLLQADRQLPAKAGLQQGYQAAHSVSTPVHSTTGLLGGGEASAGAETPSSPFWAPGSDTEAAARADLPGNAAAPPTPPAAVDEDGAAAAAGVQPPCKPVLVDWPLMLRVVKIWQIWFLACTEATKGMTVMALMLWLPVMVQSLLAGADPTQLVTNSAGLTSAQPSMPGQGDSSDDTGSLAVLLTAIPFTCAAVVTTGLGALAQRTGRPLLYNCIPNIIGGVAFLVFPWVVHANRVAGFFMLTVALACGYASSPHPMAAITQITARVLAGQHSSQGRGGPAHSDSQGTGIALPMYNTVAMLGGFFGPWLLGVAVERLGGFDAGAVAMGVCMLAAGVAVMLLCWLADPTVTPAGAYVRVADSDSSQHGAHASTQLAQQHSAAFSHPAGSCHARSTSTAPGVKGVGEALSRVGSMPGLQTTVHHKLKDDQADFMGQCQLLQQGPADGAAECVSHDAELLVRREGSSPRVRLQRGRHHQP